MRWPWQRQRAERRAAWSPPDPIPDGDRVLHPADRRRSADILRELLEAHPSDPADQATRDTGTSAVRVVGTGSPGGSRTDPVQSEVPRGPVDPAALERVLHEPTVLMEHAVRVPPFVRAQGQTDEGRT